jgi:hypothetical protein
MVWGPPGDPGMQENMPTSHRVAPGDCLASIAARFGFSDPAVIYGAPENEELRGERPNWNVLGTGDRVTVPDPAPHEVEVASGKAHRFKVKRPRVEVVVRLVSERDEPLANAKCALVINGESRPLTSDGDGLLRAPIDADLPSADLYVWADDPDAEAPSDAFRLILGGLLPAKEIAGAQARLANLGYFCGAADGDIGPRTGHALKAFQAKQGAPITGELDDATRSALEKDHGC